MSILKCKMCGGDLEVTEDMKIVECDYCGTKQTVPNADNEKKVNLFNRANRLRMASEFDKAAGIYENIIAEFPEEAEAYWGLCLCNYGIEYVDDPATVKKIPTCHRASFESLQKDENFELALEYADVVAQKIYRDEAREIDRIMGEILAISKNEKPYDVFICYKETDDKGERTVDSVLAYDIYEALTAKGFNVFFARVTLEDKLGRQYEPYIFAALNSAKVMLSIGTKYEYFHAVWVKNEWSRFLKLMAKDKSRVLIPCFKDIDAYDMPDEFRSLQAQDLGKLGAVQDIVRGVEKIISADKPEAVSEKIVEKVVVNQTAGGPNVDALLKRGNMALEDKEWDAAKEFFDQVLNMDAECAEAYLGLAMVEEKVNILKDFIYKNNIDNKNYKKAKRFANNALIDKFTKLEKESEEEKLKKAEDERVKQEEKRRRNEEKLKENAKRLEPIREKLKTFNNLINLNSVNTVCIRSDGTVLVTDRKKEAMYNFKKWNQIVAISSSSFHSVGVRKDGTVVAIGDNEYGQCNVKDWTDIVAVSASDCHTVGLKKDGTVQAVGLSEQGECDVADWDNIVSVHATFANTFGLKSDGTVMVVGSNAFSQYNVKKWTDIIAISAGLAITIGLKKDGTVVAVGDNKYGQCNVSGWEGIVEIYTNNYVTVGLRGNGTVVATGKDVSKMQKIIGWKNIVDIAIGSDHIIGLKADGTVVSVGPYNCYGECNVKDWNDIIAISAGLDATVGLKKDGTLVATGRNHFGQCDVFEWKLFDDFNNIEEERKIKFEGRKHIIEEKRCIEEKQERENTRKRNYCALGLCQHCGGTFKGLFTKKCSVCGKVKDY